MGYFVDDSDKLMAVVCAESCEESERQDGCMIANVDTPTTGTALRLLLAAQKKVFLI